MNLEMFQYVDEIIEVYESKRDIYKLIAMEKFRGYKIFERNVNLKHKLRNRNFWGERILH